MWFGLWSAGFLLLLAALFKKLKSTESIIAALGVAFVGMMYTAPWPARPHPSPLIENRPIANVLPIPLKKDETRVHIDTTPSEIAKLYASKTEYQADLLVDGYKGKWIDVEGELRETTDDRNNATMTLIASYADRKTTNHTLMSLTFSKSKFESALSSIPTGANLAATCQFDRASRAGLLLTNCELRPLTPLPR
jgi:hypothetical protein